MDRIYIVFGLDYEAKSETAIAADSRDLTQYILRIFSKSEDAKKYITDFFNEDCSEDATLEIREDKKGWLYINLSDKKTISGTIYGFKYKVRTKEITGALGEHSLFADAHEYYNG